MKTVVITGGTRGIGRAMVELFSASGWQVIFTYLKSESEARQLEKETGALGIPCDTGDEQAVENLRGEVERRFRHLDALVCNAGTAYTGLLQDMTVRQWDELFSVHVRGAFLNTRAFLPGMISRRQGAVVYISSMWGQTGASCEVAYSACKAALIGLTKGLAQETGPSGVRVNCVAPGVIRTDMLSGYTAADLRALEEQTPLSRLGTPREVAQAVLFLCSEEASFITGQVLGVNGGFVT